MDGDSFGGSMLAFTGGLLYFILSFIMGMEIGSLFVCLLILALVAFIAIALLTTFLPTNRFWLYPLMFSLPTLLMGLIAISDNFSFLSIGVTALCAGYGSEYFARWRAKVKARPNPAVNSDAAR